MQGLFGRWVWIACCVVRGGSTATPLVQIGTDTQPMLGLLIFHVLDNWLLQWNKPAKGDNLHSVRTNIYEGRSSTPSGSFVIAGHQQPMSVMHVCSAEQKNLRSTSPLLTRPYKLQIFHWAAASLLLYSSKKQYKIMHFKLCLARFLLQLSFC